MRSDARRIQRLFGSFLRLREIGRPSITSATPFCFFLFLFSSSFCEIADGNHHLAFLELKFGPEISGAANDIGLIRCVMKLSPIDARCDAPQEIKYNQIKSIPTLEGAQAPLVAQGNLD